MKQFLACQKHMGYEAPDPAFDGFLNRFRVDETNIFVIPLQTFRDMEAHDHLKSTWQDICLRNGFMESTIQILSAAKAEAEKESRAFILILQEN